MGESGDDIVSVHVCGRIEWVSKRSDAVAQEILRIADQAGADGLKKMAADYEAAGKKFWADGESYETWLAMRNGNAGAT